MSQSSIDDYLQEKNINPRSQRWVFTWNNYENTEKWDLILTEFFLRIDVIYYIYGKEVGKQGTPHLQGYFRCSKRIYKNTLTNSNIPWYVAPAKGTEEENIEYCSKQGDVEECGKRIEDGRKKIKKDAEERKKKQREEKDERMRQFLLDIKRLSIDELEALYPNQVFYHLQKIEAYKICHQNLSGAWNGELCTKNYWIWGATGTGKSRWARSQCSEEEFYPKLNNKWWGGYIPGQCKVVCFEDFPVDGAYLGQHMKIWADRYTFIGETKGSQIKIVPGTFFFIVTSNYCIDQIFGEKPDDASALKRRFREVNNNVNNKKVIIK